jgi:hypothetical protein
VRKIRLISAAVIIFHLLSGLVYAETTRIGITFSSTQSEYLGQDWKKTYIQILDMGFDIIRLGAYWSQIEKEKDRFDFSDLDWQIREAKKRGVSVVLTVGMKAPRWPEYFIPDWVLKETHLGFGADVSKNDYVKERCLKFIRETIVHCRQERIIKYWQVENEPLDRSGANKWWIDKDFLREEIELVKELDNRNRQVILNVATYPNGFLRFLSRITSPNDPLSESLQLCDILGINVYPTVGHKFFWFKLRFRTDSGQRLKYLSDIVELAKEKGKEVWATELQAEPWEPGELVHKGRSEPTTAWPGVMRETFKELHSLGIDTIFLWGGEYWHFRKSEHADESWLEAVSKLLKNKKDLLD